MRHVLPHAKLFVMSQKFQEKIRDGYVILGTLHSLTQPLAEIPTLTSVEKQFHHRDIDTSCRRIYDVDPRPSVSEHFDALCKNESRCSLGPAHRQTWSTVMSIVAEYRVLGYYKSHGSVSILPPLCWKSTDSNI
jgi:hypothetical protein